MLRPALISFAVLILSAPTSAQTSTTRVLFRLASPVFVTAPAGDQDRLFLLEKETGSIRVIDLASGEMLPDPYVTVPNLSGGGERGLLGLAFHPDFADNGRFYVYASQQGGPQHHRSQIFEYTATDPLTSNTVDANTQRSILRFDQPFGNHNGGWIGFDPTASGEAKDYLYIATGDGGSGGDPQNNSQDVTNNLLGKMLRLDTTGDDFPDDAIQNYGIPASNPFVDTEADDEIFAYGLRNPWRNSFDRQTGDLWIGDVGQGELEEIDLLPAGTSGQNYGWRVLEGTDCFNQGDARDGNVRCDDPSLVPPVYEYRHTGGEFGGVSVTGGYVYRGPVKEFQGQYFFADFASGHIWSRDPDSGTVLNRNEELDADRGFASNSVASFGEDAAGNLYVVSFGGSLYRVDSSGRDAVWDGSNAIGIAGDGTTWADANNWTRDGVTDAAFQDGDHLVLRSTTLTSTEPNRLSALTLVNANFNVTSELEIVSGNIEVPSGKASIDISETGKLTGISNALRKQGPGSLQLSLAGDAEGVFAVREGAADLNGGAFPSMKVSSGASLSTNGQLDIEQLIVEKDATFGLELRISDGSLVQHEVGHVDIEGLVSIRRHFGESDLGVLLDAGSSTLLSASTAESTGDVLIEDQNDSLRPLQTSGQTLIGSWVRTNDGVDLNVSVVRGLPGDVNLDGVVEFDDFLTFSSNFGEPSVNGWLDGDFSGAGVVGFADFLLLSANYTRTGFQTSVAAAPVPEPSALLLAVYGLLGLFRFRTVRR